MSLLRSNHQRRLLLDQVLLVKGHPGLAQVCTAVTTDMLQTSTFRADCVRLCDTLLAFRATHGYGRAIAAPQIGIPLRMIALNLSACDNYESMYRHKLSRPTTTQVLCLEESSSSSSDEKKDDTQPRRRRLNLPRDDCCFVLLNPTLTFQSPETRTVWDDCLSLPNTLVRVKRAKRIGIEWMDHCGQLHTWQPQDIEFDLAELLQHEMDHLDGVLATDQVAPFLVDDDEKKYPSVISRQEFEANKEFYQSYVDYTI